MKSNFDSCINFTLEQEGGYQCLHDDPGNWTGGVVGVGELKGTKYGISAAEYPHLDIPNLTRAQAIAIYHEDYWIPIDGDALPLGADLVVFDFGVNAGTGESARCLQSIVHVTQDGIIGPVTLNAVHAYTGDLVGALSTAHESYYEGLADFPQFGQDWLRRVHLCETTAKAMIAHA